MPLNAKNQQQLDYSVNLLAVIAFIDYQLKQQAMNEAAVKAAIQEFLKNTYTEKMPASFQAIDFENQTVKEIRTQILSKAKISVTPDVAALIYGCASEFARYTYKGKELNEESMLTPAQDTMVFIPLTLSGIVGVLDISCIFWVYPFLTNTGMMNPSNYKHLFGNGNVMGVTIGIVLAGAVALAILGGVLYTTFRATNALQASYGRHNLALKTEQNIVKACNQKAATMVKTLDTEPKSVGNLLAPQYKGRVLGENAMRSAIRELMPLSHRYAQVI